MDALNAHFQRMSDEDREALFFSPTAPLQTFSAKFRLGHAIGMYGLKLREQLETIRRIRNVFAHSVRPLQFDHPLIKKEMGTLRDISLKDVGMPSLAQLVSELRAKFIANCADLAMTFDKYARSRAGRGVIIGIPDWPDDAPPPLLHKSIRQHH
jgi:hypothetical protein